MRNVFSAVEVEAIGEEGWRSAILAVRFRLPWPFANIVRSVWLGPASALVCREGKVVRRAGGVGVVGYSDVGIVRGVTLVPVDCQAEVDVEADDG